MANSMDMIYKKNTVNQGFVFVANYATTEEMNNDAHNVPVGSYVLVTDSNTVYQRIWRSGGELYEPITNLIEGLNDVATKVAELQTKADKIEEDLANNTIIKWQTH